MPDSLLDYVLKYEAEWPARPMPVSFHLERSDDEALLKWMQHGTDEQRSEAFHALYNRYYLELWRVILKFRSKGELSDDEAKDIFSEVWFIANQKLPTEFRWSGVSVKYWLFEIANRKFLELGRIRKNSPDSFDGKLFSAAIYLESKLQVDTPAPQEISPAVLAEADRIANQVIKRLKPLEQQIVILRYFKDKDSSQIGQELNLRPGTVRTKLSRICDRLRKDPAMLEALAHRKVSHYDDE